MKYKTDEERLSLYRNSLSLAWGFVDYNDWPVKLNSIFHLFLKEFGEEFIKDLRHLEEDHSLPLSDIARLFYNPARIFRLIDSVIYSMRRNRSPLCDQRKIVLKMLSMVNALKYGSEFNEDGRNIILDPEAAAQIVNNKLRGRVCTIEESRKLHRFCGIIWAYTETIFFRAHDVTKEIHGPYYHDKQNPNILVKEYLNLQPREIWPDFMLLPCSTIKIVMSYGENVNITIDALNHLYHKGESLVPNLKGYSIEIDGKEENIEKLQEIAEIIAHIIPDMTSAIDSMSWHEKVMKYGEIFWFRKKPLREKRGICWRLPEEVKQNIHAGEVNHRRINRLSEEQVYRLAKLTI